MRDDNCSFCKIAGGDIPSTTVYEDEQFRVFLDLSPAAKGHALVVPKEHFANLFEIDDEVLRDLIVVAKKVAIAIRDALGCEGMNIVQNNGPLAGQTVFHFHLPIIPRYAADGQNINWVPGTSDPETQVKIAEAIKGALKA